MRYVISLPSNQFSSAFTPARQLLLAVHNAFGEGVIQDKPFHIDWGGLRLDHTQRNQATWTADMDDKALWLQMNAPAEATVLENTP